MERILCLPAGVLLAIAALAASVVTGMIAFSGFSLAVPGLPVFGVIGPVLSIGLVCAGIGAAASIQGLRWREPSTWALPIVMIAGLAVGGLIERNGTLMAFKAQVDAASQAAADRNARFDAAKAALDQALKDIDALKAERQLMLSDRIADAQKALLTAGIRIDVDGKEGKQTRAAMAERGAAIARKLDQLDTDVRGDRKTVEAGAQAAGSSFDQGQAELYAAGLTLLSMALAFLAPLVAAAGRGGEDAVKEAALLRTEVEAVFGEVIDATERFRA